MKNIVKIDPTAIIVVAGHSMLSGVSMGIRTVRVAVTQSFLHDMLLPAMNVRGLGRHLFSGRTVALQGVNMVIAKEPYLDVGQFTIPLRKDTFYPTTRCLNLEFPPRGNYETEAAFPTRVISGQTITDRVGSAPTLPLHRRCRHLPWRRRGAEDLVPVPGTSERGHHTGRVELRRDGSQLHRLADRMPIVGSRNTYCLALHIRSFVDWRKGREIVE